MIQTKSQKAEIENNSGHSRLSDPFAPEWAPMEFAPRDGTWLLLDIEDGSNDHIEHSTDYRPSVYLGRYAPKFFPELKNPYEWEVLTRGDFGDDEWTHWADGRVRSWKHLPKLNSVSEASS